MIVQACLNGARPPAYHPALPLDAQALAADAEAAVAAGASELHVHPRGANGRESLAAGAIDRAVAALRGRLPGTAIGVSTGAWIEGDGPPTLDAIRAWSVLPDYASVNLSETHAEDVIRLLLERGVGVEAGLAGAADAERLAGAGLAPFCLRLLVEIDEQDPAEAEAAADAVLRIVRPLGRPILLHGVDDRVWPFVGQAAAAGFSTRVGLEDGRHLPDGSEAGDNAALVAAACRIMRPA
ncbi:3-keto-5-aminohexanoate cleavage protein [Marinivivus vitaminiproducens]|uniref:3-keto-5-aminohexanoate cleavage protein n=1 Tax=Marinivivus vitaminiproducens TaxID=3035935 RepID=UPI0027A41DD4|nr:3-keto-5-aminohexanoate cleavage protein [Geminicoccaceae bacterium SCSIO 64248]